MPQQLEDCVTAVMKQGKSKESAYAICTKSLQEAGVLKQGSNKLARRERKQKE